MKGESMPTVHISCPACGGPTIPKLLLERIARRQYIQCLACGELSRVDPVPTDKPDIYELEVALVDVAHYPFSLPKETNR